MPTLPTVERRIIEPAGLAVPFVQVTGSADGPTLTVIGGVHGCEYASMDGVRRCLRTLEGRELRGRVRAVPVLTAEAGGCGLVEEHAVAQHIAGLDGVFARLEMAAAAYLGQFIWPRCATGGWWAAAVEPGDTVTQGQVIGTVSTLDGGCVQETVIAPADGVVIFVTSSPAVADDGLLLGLGAA